MPVEVVASSASLLSGTGNLTLPWPSGHQAGDIGVIVQHLTMTTATTAWPAAPAGWEVIENAFNKPTTTVRTRLLWSRATSSSEASVSVMPGTGVSLHAVRMVVLRGCYAEGTPFEMGGRNQNQGLGGGTKINGIDCHQDGSLAILAASQVYDSTAAIFSNWTAENVGAMTELFDSGTTTGGGCCLGCATLPLTKDDICGQFIMDSSQGNAYSYAVAAVATPGAPNGMNLEEVASSSGSTTGVSVTIPAGACDPGDLIIVKSTMIGTASRTVSYSGATAVGTTQSYTSGTNTYYHRIGYATATGSSQGITSTASGTVSSHIVTAYRVKNLKDAEVVASNTVTGSSTGTVALPAQPACNCAVHFLGIGGGNNQLSGVDAQPGYVSDQLTNANNWTGQVSFFVKGQLSRAPTVNQEFSVTGDSGTWAVHSIAINGTPVGGGGGSSPAMFWSNNF